MRVLHVNDHLAPKGGVETYLLSLLPRLEAAGHPQAVLYGNGDASLVKIGFGYPKLSTADRLTKRSIAANLGPVLKEFNPDIIHLHNVYNTDVIEFLLSERPVVVTSHDYRYLCPASNFYHRRTEKVCNRQCGLACYGVSLVNKCMTLRPKYSWAYLRRVRRFARRFEDFRHLIAPSQSAADRFRERGFPSQRISVLPYFCRIAPLADPRPRPEQDLILFLGRLNASKGWQYFLKSLTHLPSRVQALIVGNIRPETEVELRRLTAELGVERRITWRSWATEKQISDLLNRTSVLVFPSLWPETLGIVGLEALAHGVPVVASEIGGVNEWLKNGKNGLVVKPGDPVAIAKAVMQILDDKKLSEQMGTAGLQTISERFRPAAHIEQLQIIYKSSLL